MIRFLKRIHNIKSFSELWDAMTWQGISTFAAVPLFLLFLMPLIALACITADPMWTYIMSLDTVRKLMPVFAVAALICVVGKQHSENHPLKTIAADRHTLFWFLAFSAWLLLSTAVNGFTREARIGDEYRGEAVWTFISYGLLYFTCGMAVSSEKVKKWLYRILLSGSSVLAVTALLDRAGVIRVDAFHITQDPYYLCAIFSNGNHYAYFLLFGVLLSAGLAIYEEALFPRLLAFGSLLLHTAALVINTCRGSYLACIAALIALYIALRIIDRKRCKMFWIVLGVFIAGTVIGYFCEPRNLARYIRIASDLQNMVSTDELASARVGSHRGILWSLTLKCIAEKPLLGWGTEGIRLTLLNAMEEYGNDRPHNEYLQYAAFYGIPALCMYLGAVGSVYRRAFCQRAELKPMTVIALTAGIGYLCSAFFGNTMYYTAPYFFVTLGFAFQSAHPQKASADHA
ncbi:MAG: O-antigen ligase family protein [Oscillospiraceae bacterium]|nr:O-antigen ligase family protein [Oscillospiraceae bacterium]